MLVQTISQYLGSHKRLVVPQLGTFIVKEPGVSIVFSELLKRDDGVLRGLLREAGVGELEAAGEIDRFVFEVRHAAQHGQEFRLDGFGVLRPGPNGTIAFAYEPRPVQSAADAAPGAASVPAGTQTAPMGQKPPKLPYSIAAAIAVAAIAFGYLREANDKEAEMQYLEQPADPQPATDTGAATPEQPITE